MKHRVTDIDYTLATACGNIRTDRYKVTDSGRSFKQVGSSGWSPAEPAAQTETVEVAFKLQGGQRWYATLTGDEHRALEDQDLLQQWFGAVAEGQDPEEALGELIEPEAVGMRP